MFKKPIFIPVFGFHGPTFRSSSVLKTMVGIRDMVFEGDSEIVLDAVWGYVTPSATIGNDIMLLRGSNNR